MNGYLGYDKYVQCPEMWSPEDMREAGRTLFLAGGITGTEDWQTKFAESLNHSELVVFNPRRTDFDVNDPTMSVKQIEWEYWHLKWARARVFWFPPETLCPITLFELGKYCEKADPLFVGVHPDYKRKLDVETQLRFARPWDCEVSYYIDELSARVKNWAANTDQFYPAVKFGFKR